VASASAASALIALWRPRMRSASAGIRRCRCSSTASSLRLRFWVSSASCARTSQAMPLTISMPKSPGAAACPAPNVIAVRCSYLPPFRRTGAGSIAITPGRRG
jgi:hypothetical protein